jgi:hypothetical protein
MRKTALKALNNREEKRKRQLGLSFCSLVSGSVRKTKRGGASRKGSARRSAKRRGTQRGAKRSAQPKRRSTRPQPTRSKRSRRTGRTKVGGRGAFNVGADIVQTNAGLVTGRLPLYNYGPPDAYRV